VQAESVRFYHYTLDRYHSLCVLYTRPTQSINLFDFDCLAAVVADVVRRIKAGVLASKEAVFLKIQGEEHCPVQNGNEPFVAQRFASRTVYQRCVIY